MKVLIRGIKEDNADILIATLSELGINPAPVYRSLQAGKGEAQIECSPEDVAKLESRVGSLFQLVALNEVRRVAPTVYVLSLFLDTMLLFYILKFSLLSDEFRSLLERVFQSGTAAVWGSLLLSLLFIGLYNHAFLALKGAPPVSYLLGIRYVKDMGWMVLTYSLPLISLYLLSLGSTLSKLVGLVLLSLCVALAVYSKD